MSGATSQDDLYRSAAGTFGAALERLARAYEADPDLRRDLLQEIHVSLWRSFEAFNGRCSLRTWVYRVAHNTATSHVLRQRRVNAAKWVGLEEIETLAGDGDEERALGQREMVERLFILIQRLTPLDRGIILSYLEGMDAASIGEITGLSPENVATKIHRIKNMLASRFQQGVRDGE